jgi:hypothetical protein
MINTKLKQGIRTIFCLVLFNLLIISCSEVVEINEGELKKQNIVNSFLSPNDTINIYLHNLSNITDSAFEIAKDVEIQLYENNELSLVERSKNGKCKFDIIPKVGYEYKIKFLNNNGNYILARDTIPQRVSILDATNLYPVYTDNYGTTFGKITLVFNDEVKETNYYEIIILNEQGALIHVFKIKNPVISVDNENDPISPNSLLFTDELFNGQELKLEIFTEAHSPVVILKNVSYTYYHYRKSIINHIYNQNRKRDDVYNLFKGNPVTLYSNIENGLGIFTAYSQDIKKCTLINQ